MCICVAGLRPLDLYVVRGGFIGTARTRQKIQSGESLTLENCGSRTLIICFLLGGPVVSTYSTQRASQD